MLSVVTLTVLLVAVVALAAALAAAIGASYRRPDPEREALAERLAQVRLGRAVAALGLGEARYLRAQPLVAVGAQIARCAACPDPAGCDRAFERDGLPPEFCPNRAALLGLAAGARPEVAGAKVDQPGRADSSHNQP